jgi:hypothetical protein
MGKKIVTMGLIASLIISFGCAATMAAKQPEFTDLSVLRQGASRSEVISALGRPIAEEKDKDGNLVETYQFKQGYTKTTRVVRVMFHVVADVFTLFLWEFIGMPMEVIFDGNKVTVEATYNGEKRLQESIVLEK